MIIPLPDLILASASPRRVDLLKRIGVVPACILKTDIDETPRVREKPAELAQRLAGEKAQAALEIMKQTRSLSEKFPIQESVTNIGSRREKISSLPMHFLNSPAEGGKVPAFLILAADTLVSVGRRILPKCLCRTEAETCLERLSGRAHRVHTAVTLLNSKGQMWQRLSETRLHFKRLSQEEREHYLQSEEWCGKAGGYAIQGAAEAFVIQLSGSYSSVIGLPLYETKNLLTAAGYFVSGRCFSATAEPEPVFLS